MNRLSTASIDRIISLLLDPDQPRNKDESLVLLGFPMEVYTSASLSAYRLFRDVPEPQDLASLVAARKEFVQVLAAPASMAWPCWCTYEEYIAASPDTFRLFKSPIFLSAGIFNKAFPLAYNLSGWNQYFVELCSEPEEADSIEPPPTSMQQAFDAIYSSILTVNNQWFVSYINLPSVLQEVFVETSEAVSPVSRTGRNYSLGAEESAFLEVILAIDDPDCCRLEIYIEEHLTPPHFIDRIRRFQNIVKSDCFIDIKNRPPTTASVKKYPEILDILRSQWNYETFRTLRVYKNLTSYPLDKSTTEIQQSEVIEAILEQAENAFQGSPYRDVFVTAPTGSGKSLLFQIPALFLAKKYGLMTIIISPLIGLMNDQVENLYLKNVDCAATINSGIAPAIRDEIQARIENKEISILYVSPETLLSRSDISILIGSRRVGLVIVDEAHIVTTWGKAFRSDYWYLGTYLQKLRRSHPCLVATFTATAIYGGIEDMFVETRESLNMVNPKTYFGYVPRENIQIHIQNKSDYKGKGHEYLHDKYGILLERLKDLQLGNAKTLVYFPMVNMIEQFIEFARANGAKSLLSRVGRYYGPLEPSEKDQAYRAFRSGKYSIMLATKAFGMGIDIPDIAAIYHFAPTGNVCDYVQEIGRAARQLPVGYAILDYLPGDFSHVNRLHGISTLTTQQLVGTLKKILEIARTEGDKRRLLIKSDDFRYLFATTINTTDEEVDNKLKTALLILEKDFVNRYGYAAILARPRQLFTIEYFSCSTPIDQELPPSVAAHCQLDPILSKSISANLYKMDLKSIWATNFPKLSFAQFKYYFRTEPEKLQLPSLRQLSPILMLRLQLNESLSTTSKDLSCLVDALNATFAKFTNPNRKFIADQFEAALEKIYPIPSKRHGSFGAAVLQSAHVFCSLMKRTHINYQWFLQWDRDDDRYQLKSTSYQDYGSWLLLEFSRFSHSAKLQSGQLSLAVGRCDRLEVLNWYTFLGALEEYGLGVFNSQGGENPEIFVRINSPLVLQQVVDQPEQYRNTILENVHLRHRLSVAMLHYLFTDCSATSSFWASVEDYFLGKIPQQVLDSVSRHGQTKSA